MAFFYTQNISLTAISGAVPKEVIYNREYNVDFFGEESVNEIVNKTGIEERRFAPDGMCASDYCLAAANELFDQLEISRDTIDILIFVSQTPDYRMPATSVILQNELGLPKTCAAFDVNLGCSAFVYGLSIAYSYLQNTAINKVLLLDGETRSRVYSPKDRKTAFLFGDGGVAALIEKNTAANTYFSLNSDGARSELIKVDSGGYRNPSSVDSLTNIIRDKYGNERLSEHAYMKGAEVFNFLLSEIPKEIKFILKKSNINKGGIDYFLFHQANSFMNNYLAKKLKIEGKKVPTSISKFGNTSSVSIPLTMLSELKETEIKNKNLLLSGFGVGMSWASCIIENANVRLLPLMEI